MTVTVDLTSLDSEINALITASGVALPSQTGNSGKYLTTNGSACSWATVAAGGLTSAVDAGTYALTQAGLTSAITAAGSNGSIFLPATTYTLSSTLSIPDNFTVYAGNTIFDASAVSGVAISLGSNVKWRGSLEIFGAGAGSPSTSSIMVHCSGTNNSPSAPTYIKGPQIDEINIYNAPGYAVLFEYVNDFHIAREIVHDYGYAAHMDISVTRGLINFQHHYNGGAGVGGNLYCYSATKNYGGLTDFPRTTDILIEHAVWENNHVWQAFDTHGAQRITVKKAYINDCLRGVWITYSKNDATTPTIWYAAKDCEINATCENPYGDNGEALFITGAYNGSTLYEAASGHRINVKATGFGWSANQSTGAFWFDGVKDSEIKIFSDQAKINSVYIAANNSGLTLIDPIMRDPHDDATDPSCIRIGGSNNDIAITGYSQFQRRNTGLDTKVTKYGISFAGSLTGNTIRLSPSYLDESQTPIIGQSGITYLTHNTVSFTPTIVGSTTAGSGTYTTQVGTYTRIGNAVFFDIRLGWSAHTGTGSMSVTLPFTAASTNYPNGVYQSGLNVGAGLQFTGQVINGTNTLALYSNNPTGASTWLAMDTVVSDLGISGFFFI